MDERKRLASNEGGSWRRNKIKKNIPKQDNKKTITNLPESRFQYFN